MSFHVFRTFHSVKHKTWNIEY